MSFVIVSKRFFLFQLEVSVDKIRLNKSRRVRFLDIYMRNRLSHAVHISTKMCRVVLRIFGERENFVTEKLANQASSAQSQNWWTRIPSLAYRDHIL